MQKFLKVLAYMFVALVALKIIGEILSLMTSMWFIIAAVAVWWFFLRKDKTSSHLG